jgi:hypothetical protein
MAKARFGRVPDTVGADSRLSATDVRVYWALARSAITSGEVVNLGTRLIAKTACCTQRQVVKSLGTLKKTGHIDAVNGERGSRAIYRLLSPVFASSRHSHEETVFAEGNLKVTRKRRGPAYKPQKYEFKEESA